MLHWRGRAGRRRALERLKRGVVLEHLTNALGALVTEVVSAEAERDAREWQQSVRPRVGRPRVGASASKPARGRAQVRNMLHWRGRAGGQRALECLERGVVLERLTYVIGALGTDAVG